MDAIPTGWDRKRIEVAGRGAQLLEVPGSVVEEQAMQKIDDGIARLRQLGQDLADQWNEPVLMVLDPPRNSVTGYQPELPYCTFVRSATPAEVRVATERFEPQSQAK